MAHKHFITCFFVMMLSCVNVIHIYGDEERINIQHVSQHDDVNAITNYLLTQ